MSSRGHARWLLSQLPDWVARDLVDARAAERIRARYAPLADARVDARRILLWLGSVGLLAGGLLLVAANWDHWSRSGRSAWALGLLVAAQAAALGVARRDGPDAPGLRREIAGAAWCAAVLASLALMSQAWQVQGDLAAFLMVAILLCAPVPWVGGAHGPVALGLGLTAAWAFQPGTSDLVFSGLVFAQSVRVLWLRERGLGPVAGFVIAWPWVAILLLGAALRLGLEHGEAAWWTLLAAGSLALAVGSARGSGFGFARAAARSLGALALAGTLLGLSFAGPFDALFDVAELRADGLCLIGVVLGFGAAAAWLARDAARSGDRLRLGVLAAPFAVLLWGGLALLLDRVDEFAIGVAAGAVALAVAAIVSGARREESVRVHAGLGLIGALGTAHFLSADWSFAARALGFMIGGGLLLAVAWATRRAEPGAAP